MNSLAKRCGVSLLNVLPILLLSGRLAFSYTPEPRWGQAVVLINDTLFVYGGKTDLFNSYSYTSAPTTNELLYLPLSQPFNTTNPPWELMNSSRTSETPNVSWHTLSAFNYSGVLLFGGQPGTSSPIVTFDGADSASLLDLSNSTQPAWYPDLSWVGEPVRRVFHSSVTCPTTGKIYIIGGQAADGSQHAFSDHYMFDPHTLAFSIIPPNNGPPALYGHASVILTDGRMFIFGGVSEDFLSPLSDVWTLDTSNINPVWEKIQVDSSSLPKPRRAFAAVAIGQGKILIQGGSDADLLNNVNDGWILDTSKDPAIWTQVAELTQLGARRDHYAILSNDLVIFGFGYLNSGPAPAAIQIFDPSLNSYPFSYSPPPPSASVTQTIPGPSTTTSGTGTHPTGTISTIQTSTEITQPGPVPTAIPGDHVNHKKNSVVATAVGTTLGVLGTAALALIVILYARRQRRTNRAPFTPIEDDNGGDERDPHEDPIMPIATRYSEKGVVGTSGWGNNLLGTAFSIAGTIGVKSRNGRHRYRRDMLADEDTREFGEWYNARRRDGTGGSSWSLKSVFGARFRSRDPSIFGSSSHRQEKTDPFSDGASLMQDQEPGPSFSGGKERSRHGGDASPRATSSYSYIDPFEDPVQEEREGKHQQQLNRNRDSTEYQLKSGEAMISHPQAAAHIVKIITPSSIPAYSLSPLLEHMPDISTPDHDQTTTSSHTQSSGILSGVYGSLVTSQTSVEPFRLSSKSTIESPESPQLRSPSIIPAGVSPSDLRRSDSWWSRFYRTSFLDRRPSSASHRSNILDIRDPNPPPLLVPIEESTSSVSAEEISLKSVDDLAGSKQLSGSQSRVYTTDPGRSMSSLRTADTEQIEKMAAAVDVVQRVRTPSQITSNSIGSGLSIDTCKAGSNHNEQGELMVSSSLADIAPSSDIPIQGSLQRTPHKSVMPVSPRSSPLTYPCSPSTSTSKPSVADRVKMYERRTSQDQDLLPPTNTKKLEERSPKKERVTINYGLTPRANLFVVNPDHRNSRSSDS